MLYQILCIISLTLIGCNDYTYIAHRLDLIDRPDHHWSVQTNSSNCLYLTSKQLLLFVFAWRSECQYSMAEKNHAAQWQTAVTAYFTSKQLLLFVFAWRSECQYSMAEENPAAQIQTAATAYLQVSSYCCLSLRGGQDASTRWQKRILQLKDKQQ